MRKLLHLFTASIILFSGCESYNGDIDASDGSVDELTSPQITTINKQINAIKTAITYLEKVDDELTGYINTLEDTADDLEAAIEMNETKISDLKTELTEADAKAKAEIIAQLDTATSSLKAELTKVNKTITELQNADIALDEKIQTLSTYVDDELSDMKDWCEATFATLEQYSDLVDDISTINGQITSLNTSVSELETSLNDTVESIAALEGDVAQDLLDLSSEVTTTYTSAIASAKSDIEAAYEGAIETAIDDLESSLQKWVNEKLTGYYTIAQTETELTTLQEALETQLATQKSYLEGLVNELEGDFIEDVKSMKTTIANIETAVASNAKDITDLKSDLATVKAELTDDYTAAIATAISTLDGKLRDDIDEVNSNLTTEINGINISIDDLSDRVTTIESEIDDIKSTLLDLQDQIADIMSRIQSVVYVPEYSDGNATILYYNYEQDNSAHKTSTLSYKINPSSVAADLVDVWETALGINATYTLSRAIGDFTELEVTAVSANNGVLTLDVSCNNLSDAYFLGEVSASVGLNISDGNNDISSEFTNIVISYEDVEDVDVIINSKTTLANFRNRVNAGETALTAKVIVDIDLTDIEWMPIGTTQNAYTGTFDGGEYTISNLAINSSSNYQGFFGHVKGGTIKNLILDNPQVKGGSQIGAVCGSLFSGTISSCGVTNGSVLGTGCYVGGVVGSANDDSSITACYNTASVLGTGYSVGGVVGSVNFSSITACYNTATVSGTAENVGGVVGYSSHASITACYNTASFSGTNLSVGGVVGFADYDSSDTACYYISYVGYNSHGTRLSTLSELNTNVETMNSAANSAYFKVKNDTILPTLFDEDITYEYKKRAEDVTISTAEQLKAFRDLVNSNPAYAPGRATITADIDLKNEEWIPISVYYGIFDGAGHTISNLSINGNSGNQGLFGCVNGGGSIKDLILDNPQVIGEYNTGAVCGVLSWGTISGCGVTNGSVSGTGSYVGGVVGSAYNDSSVIACYNTATVSGTRANVGGVVGYSNCSITACYNTATVSGIGGNVGGVIGSVNNAYSSITACYFIDQDGDDVSSGIGSMSNSFKSMKLSSVSELNEVVSDLNSATKAELGTTNEVYFTAGSPSTTHLPSLFDENIEY